MSYKSKMSDQSKKSKLSEKYLFVAAIDFGTTYSGYAFSSRDDFNTNPLKVSLNTWSGSTLLSQKTSTCVLFDPTKQFKKFGFEAEDKYADLADDEDEDHRKWYFFRRFKMSLFDKMKLKKRFMLEDETGKKMSAMTVFSACIRYLKDRMMSQCRNMMPDIEDTDIRWVLTVPAIWNDVSKQFMRVAAEDAGITSDSLLIALEPEAASLCCRYVPVHSLGDSGSNFQPFQPNSKYMVFDAGGGTIDITVHQVLANGNLRELYAANGGSWGGTYVDKAFHNFLASIVGNNVLDDFGTQHTGDYFELFRDFELKKRNFRNTDQEKINMKVPIKLTECFEGKDKNRKIKDHIDSTPDLKGRVSWIGDKLKMDPTTAKSFFSDACNNILCHLEALFSSGKVDDVPTILMVGGFSESPMLQELMKSRFKNKRIIIPADPGIAVLKGAVIFGHDPDAIEERRCRYTYGVETSMTFRKGKDPEKEKFTDGKGEVYCSKRFSKHVEIGQPVVVGQSQQTKSYSPAVPEQKEIKFLFFASSECSPEYTYDKCCIPMGDLTIELQGSGMDRSVEVTMTFSGTELAAEAKDIKSGKRVNCSLNFLG